ncbi:nuclease, partial [Candidatus Kaiserbacteria bacterium]|nr:nuclease [Candidatus Kaiserbacteria bacterium]
MILARTLVVGCLLAAQSVLADFSGKVVGVSDGDTITVLKD